MRTTKFAVFTNEAIYGIGDTISEAMADAYKNDMSSSVGIVQMNVNGSYSGGVVDLSAAMKLAADGEAVSGADAKLRRCSDALAKLVLNDGGAVKFYVTHDGVLDTEPE